MRTGWALAARSARLAVLFAFVWGIPAVATALDSWAYQLQELTAGGLATLGGSASGLLVIDYSSDGSGAGEHSPAQIEALRNGPCGPRPVLAYMSIGEAEDYRFYWDPAWTDGGGGDPDRPPWLGPTNPEWAGNYKVRYWYQQWQEIIVPAAAATGTSYLERILAQGFDGVYLDIVDAYEFFGPDGNNENPDAAADMAAFVSRIASFGRSRRPGFQVFPQNASALAHLVTGYVAGVDGIGAEDTFYNDNSEQPPEVVAEVTADLDLFLAAGKLVLSVDYVTQAAKVDDYYARAQAKGYVAYAATRDLDRLVIHPGHAPSCAATPTPTSTPAPTPTPTATPPPRVLTGVAAPASAQNPCWIGPDRLLFTLWPAGYNQGLAQLWTLALGDGGAAMVVGDDDSTNVNLAGRCYHPASSRVVFSRETTARDEIWTATVDGTDLTRVLADPAAVLIEPSWSADGQWIVFERRDPQADSGAVWKVRPDGSGATPLTDGSGDDRQPNASPVDARVVFQSRRTGDWEVWILALGGGVPVNVSQAPAAEDTDPAFSPDGSGIVFSSDRGGLPLAKLFVVPAAGGEPVRVTQTESTVYEGAPAWSPAGDEIAFEASTGEPDAGRTQLWIAGSAGLMPGVPLRVGGLIAAGLALMFLARHRARRRRQVGRPS